MLMEITPHAFTKLRTARNLQMITSDLEWPQMVSESVAPVDEQHSLCKVWLDKYIM